MSAIYKKELKSYFSNMTGYIAIALILVVAGILSRILNFRGLYGGMEGILPTLSMILMLAVPIVAMRSFAEERQLKTDLLLYCLPLKTTQIVLGKYFAMMTVFAVPTGAMLLYPLILSMYGKVNFLSAVSSLLAFYLLCGAMCAICMFMSSLTESQVIAAVLGVSALVVCYASTILAEALPTTAIASFLAFTVLICLLALVVYYFAHNYWVAFTVGTVLEAGMLIAYLIDGSRFAGLFQKVIDSLSLFQKMNEFVSLQLFDTTVLIYFLSVSFLFCFFTVQTVEKRRWS